MLKHSLATALFSYLIFSLSSCVQAYECECVTTENGEEVFRATDTYTGTKHSTQRICDDFEKNQNKIGASPGRNTECTLK